MQLQSLHSGQRCGEGHLPPASTSPSQAHPKSSNAASSTTGIPPHSHAHCPGVGRLLLGSSDQASSSFPGSLLEPSTRLSQLLPRDPLNKRDLISTLLDAHRCSRGHIPLRIKQSGFKQGYILASPGEGLMLLSDPTSRLGTLHVGTTPPVHCGQPRPHLSRSPLTSPNSTFLIH